MYMQFNFNFLRCLGLIDQLSANRHAKLFACILLSYRNHPNTLVRANYVVFQSIRSKTKTNRPLINASFPALTAGSMALLRALIGRLRSFGTLRLARCTGQLKYDLHVTLNSVSPTSTETLHPDYQRISKLFKSTSSVYNTYLKSIVSETKEVRSRQKISCEQR